MNFTKIKDTHVSIWIWLIVECLLYISFLIMDFNGRMQGASHVKFSSILFCFLFVAAYQVKVGKRENWLLVLSLGFSAAADIFLLFTENFVPGMILFLVVQSLIGWYLIKKYKISFGKQIGLRVFLSILLIWIVKLQNVSVDFVCVLGCFYIVSFGGNVVCSIYGTKKNLFKCDLLLMAGLILFFCCDINVGIFNLSAYITFQSPWWIKLESISAIAMWFFYLPGQVLIGLSGILESQGPRGR